MRRTIVLLALMQAMPYKELYAAYNWTAVDPTHRETRIIGSSRYGFIPSDSEIAAPIAPLEVHYVSERYELAPLVQTVAIKTTGGGALEQNGHCTLTKIAGGVRMYCPAVKVGVHTKWDTWMIEHPGYTDVGQLIRAVPNAPVRREAMDQLVKNGSTTAAVSELGIRRKIVSPWTRQLGEVQTLSFWDQSVTITLEVPSETTLQCSVGERCHTTLWAKVRSNVRNQRVTMTAAIQCVTGCTDENAKYTSHAGLMTTTTDGTATAPVDVGLQQRTPGNTSLALTITVNIA